MNLIQAEAQERIEIKHKLRRYGAIGWKSEDSTEYLEEVLNNRIRQLREELK